MVCRGPYALWTWPWAVKLVVWWCALKGSSARAVARSEKALLQERRQVAHGGALRHWY